MPQVRRWIPLIPAVVNLWSESVKPRSTGVKEVDGIVQPTAGVCGNKVR